MKFTRISLIFVFLISAILIFEIMKANNERNLLDYKVERIIDGDTFELYSGDIVRLICIDAPELETEQGKKSKEFLESLILDKIVILEKDVSEKDRYGRLLRYVYFNNTLINKELVENGYASILRFGNDTKKCDEIEGI